MKNLHFCFSFLLVIAASSFTIPTNSKNVSPVDNCAAQFDYFIEIDGIKGESTDSRHKGWVEISSHRMNAEAKTVTVIRPITPIASPQIKRLSESRSLLKKVLVDQDGGAAYELKNVLITSYQTSSSSGVPTESFTLHYTEIK